MVCLSLDLCHDRCACLAGHKELIKFYFWVSRGGDGTGLFIPFGFCPALPPSVRVRVWLVFFLCLSLSLSLSLCLCYLCPSLIPPYLPINSGRPFNQTSYATKANEATTMQESILIFINSTTKGIYLTTSFN